MSGVKYLHHEAKAFDIGIYFEANGHGTVLFKPALLQHLQDLDEQVSQPARHACWLPLKHPLRHAMQSASRLGLGCESFNTI